MESQTTAVTPISQTTDRGINNLSFTETINAQNAPLFPVLPRFTAWDKWPLRWIGCFCFGASIPSWLVILPPVGALTFSTLTLLGAIVLGGWAVYRRENLIPAAVTVLVIFVGIIFSIGTYLNHAKPQPDTQPLSNYSSTLSSNRHIERRFSLIVDDRRFHVDYWE